MQRRPCLLVCKDGFVPIGRKRVACRNRDGELNWTKTTGKCVTCDPLIPQPKDVAVKTDCRTGRGKRICSLSCADRFKHNNRLTTKLTCTCPRGNCQWKEKRRSAPWEDFTCRTPQTAAPATSENEFKTGPERLTATDTCSMKQNIFSVSRQLESNRIINGVDANKNKWPFAANLKVIRSG